MALDPNKPFEIESAEPWGSGRFYYKLNTNQGTFYYAPTEFVQKGLVSDGIQFYDKGFVNNKDLVTKATTVELPKGLATSLEAQSGYTNANRGVLFTEDQFNSFLPGKTGGVQSYAIDPNDPKKQPIQGLTDVVKTVAKNGKVTSNRFTYFQGSTKSGDKTTIYRIGDTGGTGTTTITVDKPGGILGSFVRAIGSIPLLPEIAGLATGNPMVYGALKGTQVGVAGGSPLDAATQVGTGLLVANVASNLLGPTSPTSVGGTPGVSEVYPVDMGYTAPGTPIAPIDIATAIPAGELAFPGVEIGANSTPAPGSFKASLPEFGVDVPAGATAVPGSFAAALPTLLSPAAAASAFSVSDVLRGARLANNLMGLTADQPQAQPQRQDIGQMQATGVDVLRLPQLTAGTLDIAGLLSPGLRQQIPQFDVFTGQSLLPSQRLSLLG